MRGLLFAGLGLLSACAGDERDATEERRGSRTLHLERVLTGDPAMGVFRHVDAGYDKAQRIANERGVRIPGFNC